MHDLRLRVRSPAPLHRGSDEELPAKRIHFDVRPREGTRDKEVARVVAMGARQVGDQRGRYGPGTGWVVLADPEGNEFCILRSLDEVHADQPPARQEDLTGRY